MDARRGKRFGNRLQHAIADLDDGRPLRARPPADPQVLGRPGQVPEQHVRRRLGQHTLDMRDGLECDPASRRDVVAVADADVVPLRSRSYAVITVTGSV